MLKSLREVYQMVERAGLKITDQKPSGTGHIRLVLEAPNGATKVFTIAKTASDYRTLKNSEADLRRFAREHVAPTALTLALAQATKPPHPSPPPPKEPEMPNEPSPVTLVPPKKAGRRKGTQLNRLDGASRFKLFVWFAALPQEVLDTSTHERLAKLAEGALEVPVTKANILTAFEATGRKREPVKAPSASDARLDALEKRIAQIETILDQLRQGQSLQQGRREAS